MDLVTRVAVDVDGPIVAVFNAVPAGSSLSFSFYFEDEDPDDPGTFLPKDFTDLTLVSEVRLSVYDVAPISGGVTVAEGSEPGYLDFFVPASTTTGRGDKILYWGFKMVPSDADQAVISAVGEIPITLAGVR